MAGDRPDFYDLIASNRRRTWLLMFAFFVLLAVVGAVISLALGGGIVGVIIGVVISFGFTFASYFQSDTLALRSTRAVEADPREFSQLNNLVAEVSLAAGIPQPRVFVVHDPSPNAFATGRNVDNAVVAVTTGLMDKMNRQELEGVIAHEIAHIRNGDILVMTVAVATAGSIALIADIFWRMLYFGALTGGGASHRRRSNDGNGGANPLIIVGMVVVAVLAPLAAALLRAAVSRSRESLADATAVEITRYPAGLRQALEKLDADITVVAKTSHATSHLWIESPDDHETEARGRRFNDMFSTHPPLSERINILREMEGLPAYEGPDPVVAESLRTLQDNRANPETGMSFHRPAATDTALDTVDLTAIFPGMGEVAPADDHPDHAPAGWYHDPDVDDGALRYWDGRSLDRAPPRDSRPQHGHAEGGPSEPPAPAAATRPAQMSDADDEPTVGVGPHPQPWPSDPRLDPDLLAEGDRRNVEDRYRYWTVEAIIGDLDEHRHDFHVAIENWEHDRNIGTVVRTADAFLAAEVHIIGRRKWNRRGAMMTDVYQHIRHHDTVDALISWARSEELPIIGIDNLPGSLPIESADLPQRCVLLFGQEGPGLSPAARAASETVCSIAQFGSTRSINAGVAAGIAMHAWVRRWAKVD